MDLKGLIFGYTPEPLLKIRGEFGIKIERMVNKMPVHFDARVKGHFVPKGGRAEFVADEIPWAHLDIAGMADTSKELPYCPEGGTGFGVRLLVDYLENQ